MVKRVFDFIFSGILLLLLSPVLALIAMRIKRTMGSPVIFRQARGGYRGSVFEILKFRTMTVDSRNENGSDAVRITPLGRLLRQWSLDELPELWNVVRGEMSLVGPRPFIAEYLSLYTPEQARRLDARPGLTGWAQVNGRNALSWEEKFALDIWYVDNCGFWLDLKILWMTFIRVVRHEGISAEGDATMPKFTGSGNG